MSRKSDIVLPTEAFIVTTLLYKFSDKYKQGDL